MTALTYQSVAVFDPEAEAPDAPVSGAENPRSRRDSTRTARRWWPGSATQGRSCSSWTSATTCSRSGAGCSAELLEQLPQAVVLGLTATRPRR